MKVHVYDIEWEIDEDNLSGIQSHTGEKWGHLLSDAEDEQEELPSEITFEVDEDKNLEELHDFIDDYCEVFYCDCVDYTIDEDSIEVDDEDE